MENNNGKSLSSKWWATVIYNDCDLEIIDKCIKSFHLPCILSPLHSRDIEEDSERKSGLCNEITEVVLKEPHYHLMVCFPNAVSVKSFKYLLEHKLVACVHWKGCEKIFSENGYARYLCHLDDLDKAQYSIDYLLYYGGYDSSVLESPMKNERETFDDIKFLIDIIIKCGVEDMITLVKVVDCMCPDKMNLVLRHSSTLERFTRGMYQSSLRRERKNNFGKNPFI